MKKPLSIPKQTALPRYILFVLGFVVMGLALANGVTLTSGSEQEVQNTSKAVIYPPVVNAYRYDNNAAIDNYQYPPLSNQQLGNNPFVDPASRTSYESSGVADNRRDQFGYRYPPTQQKHGSNPYFRNYKSYATKAQPEAIQYPSTVTNEVNPGVVYMYPPLTKKLGSNPLLQQQGHHYADKHLDSGAQEGITASEQQRYHYHVDYQRQHWYTGPSSQYFNNVGNTDDAAVVQAY